MGEKDGLLQIGIFSLLSHISVRMLRHYQEHGILIPMKVDPFSGYRLYSPEQLDQAHIVVQLRDAGFSVDGIAEVLAHRDDPQRVDQALNAQRLALGRRRKALHKQSVALANVSITLKGYPVMTEVTRKQLPAMTVASVRQVIPTFQDEWTLWGTITLLLKQAQISFPTGGLLGATYYDPEYRDQDVDVEVWVQVAEAVSPAGALQCKEIPQQEVVTATLRGDYSQMPAVTKAIGAYIAEHELRTGPMFNIYQVSPAQNPDPSSWITEVCFPIVG